jgi:hypothetical protein
MFGFFYGYIPVQTFLGQPHEIFVSKFHSHRLKGGTKQTVSRLSGRVFPGIYFKTRFVLT